MNRSPKLTKPKVKTKGSGRVKIQLHSLEMSSEHAFLLCNQQNVIRISQWFHAQSFPKLKFGSQK